jgi:hypothetical protein
VKAKQSVIRFGAAAGGGNAASPGGSIVLGPNTILGVDDANGSIARSAVVPDGPVAIAVDDHSVWTAAVQAGVVARLDFAGSGAPQTFGRVGRPSAIAIGAGTVWISDSYDNRLVMLDAGTGEQRDSSAAHVRQLAYGLDALWGTDDLHDRLVRFDRQTATPSASISLADGSVPTGLAIAGSAIWIANVGSQTLTRLDGSSGAIVVDGVALRGIPDRIAASASDVWVTSSPSDLLMRIDPGSNTVVSTTTIWDAPVDAAVDPTGVWVACAGSGAIWHVAASGEVTARVDVGGRPTAIVVAGNTVWVAVASP